MIKVRLTAEQAIFGGLVLLAALVRVWNLGSLPLQPGEAAVALPSWYMFRGLPSTVDFGPVITYGNGLLFSTVGANDASARLLPAVAGCVLVALCYFVRPYVGRYAAISSAFLLSISPTSVFFSRFVGSELIVASATLASVILLFRYLGGRGPAYLYGFAAAMGLAVSAGASGFVNMVIVLAFVGVLVLVRRTGGDRLIPALTVDGEATDGGDPTLALHRNGAVMRKAALIFAGVVVLVATGMFSNLHGVQEGVIAPLFLQTSPLVTAAGYSPAYYLQLLFLYETPVIAFAFIRVVFSSRPKGLFSWFLIWWAFTALIFYSAWPQKSALLIIQPLIPTVLLAGEMIGGIMAWMEAERFFDRLVRPLVVLIAATFPFLMLLVLLLNQSSLPAERMRGEFAILLLVVLALAIAGFISWRGAEEATRLGAIYLLALLLVVYVHAGSNLNFRGALSPTELLVPSVTVEDVRNLADDISDLQRLAGDPAVGKGIFVESGLRYPLAWYLRNVEGVEYAPQPGGNPSIIVAKEGFAAPSGQRATQKYLAQVSWQLSSPDWAPLWRWMVYREPTGPLRYEVAELSVRQ